MTEDGVLVLALAGLAALMLPSAVHQLAKEEPCSGGSGGALAASSEPTSGPKGRPAATTADAGSTDRWGDYAAAIARDTETQNRRRTP